MYRQENALNAIRTSRKGVLRGRSNRKQAQKRSFLKKKPTWFVLSLLAAGLLYLLMPRLIIIFNIEWLYLLLGEELSDLSLSLLSGFFVAQLLVSDDGLEVEVGGDHVSGGHDVIVVHSLHEGLDLGTSLDLLLAHAACDFQSVSLNAGNESVRELSVLYRVSDSAVYLLSIVVLLHNDSFLSSVSSSKQNDDSARLHTIRHKVRFSRQEGLSL